MLKSDIPSRIVEAFGTNADGSTIRSIPLTSATPGAASFDKGFPAATMTPVAAGGIPPDGRDMNGVLLQSTQWLRWLAGGGGMPPWDSAFASSSQTGGYPKDCIVASAVTDGLYYLSTADNNTNNPDAAGAPVNWTPFWLPWKAPTIITKLSGSGNVTPSDRTVLYWRVRMVGGGGGGGFTAGPSTSNNGSNGTLTSLRDWTVNPGAGGFGNVTAGVGGTGGTNGTGTLIRRTSGSAGQSGWNNNAGTSLSITASSCGGGTALGSGAGSSPANTGAGGRADGTLLAALTMPGGGGGGEFVEFLMPVTFGTNYAYAVGPGGGASGSSQAGAAGGIYIEEIYG